jgi:hypothetical protein
MENLNRFSGEQRLAPRVTAVLAALVAAAALSACDECKNDSDCGLGQMCVSGECQGNAAVDTDTDTDTDIDTDNDTDVDTDTDNDTDVDTDGDTDTDTDSDGDLENGSSCDNDGDCISNHCGDGFCCAAGECCPGVSSPGECDDSLCNERYCADFQCSYPNMVCGAVDAIDGDTCMDGSRCDGYGGCVVVTPCGTGYAGDGTYLCSAGVINENCLSGCDGPEDCAATHYCDTGTSTCVAKLADGGSPCVDYMQCLSGNCNTFTGVCCASGYCCNSADDCAFSNFVCDSDIWACAVSCGTGADEDDALCASEDFHCQGGMCVADFIDSWNCSEDSDCQSGYCDLSSYVCCSGGTACCQTTDDCDGYVCLVDEGFHCADGCAPYGIDLDELCDLDHYCEADECVLRVESGGLCSEDYQCVDGHCEGGVCCGTEAGDEECCLDVGDCDLGGSQCVTRGCGSDSVCNYAPMGCGAYDLGDGDTCTDANRCDGYGNCVTVTGCPVGYLPSTGFDCVDGGVTAVCDGSCSDDFDCVDEYHCEGTNCVLDLDDGEETCDSNFDCASGNCNGFSGVCCEDGYCCNDDGDCPILTCNLISFSCDFLCTSDAQCESTYGANYHCDDSVCEEDVEDGEAVCDEASDCVSGYCDTSNGLCCDAGNCCQTEATCGGFACTVFSCETDCSPGGIEDDALCATGYHCSGSVCVADIPNGGSVCVTDSDCVSGNCDEGDGVCCELGLAECCSSPAQCDDGSECTYDDCGGGYGCEYTPKEDGESCDDGAYCNGTEECWAGVCEYAADPCLDMANPCQEGACVESTDSCSLLPINEGDACSEALYCLSGETMVCQSGFCEAAPDAENPCDALTPPECQHYVCNETGGSCDLDPMGDGMDCGGSTPCNVEPICLGGECIGSNPCDVDGDPCTETECTVSGPSAICGSTTPIADGDPCNNGLCAGAGAYCYDGDCIDGEDAPCNDDDICTVDQCSVGGGGATCTDIGSGPTVALACGANSIAKSDFATREYYDYTSGCDTWAPYPGKEAILTLAAATDGSYTLAISGIAPPSAVKILRVDSACDPESCLQVGAGSLTSGLIAGTHTFILEAPDGVPPSGVTVTVTCP